ncbi:hypothetical protein NLX69_03045 [Rossellomorea sp. BNER]|nr:hypothetical protein [Rossellomorea sp. BNER]
MNFWWANFLFFKQEVFSVLFEKCKEKNLGANNYWVNHQEKLALLSEDTAFT